MLTTKHVRRATRTGHATRWLALAALFSIMLAPRVCHAVEGGERPSLFAYGINGFGTGAGIGFAVGYLSIGDEYEDGEWRNLVYGAGIGALAGLGTGVLLGAVDSGSDGLGTGWYVLRDMGFGATLGALSGAVVGALVWASDGEAGDLAQGAAIGTIAGAGIGIIFGIIEGVNEADDDVAVRDEPRVALSAVPVPGGARVTSTVQLAF